MLNLKASNSILCTLGILHDKPQAEGIVSSYVVLRNSITMRLPSVWQTGATSKNTCPLPKESERCCKLGQQMLWISKIHPSNFGTCLAWNFSLLSASWWSFPMEQYQAWRDKKHECPCRWFSQNVYDMQMATSIPLFHYTPVISQAHQFSIFAETLFESHCQDCPTKQISVLNSKAQHWIRSTWQCQSNPWHSEANDSSTDARLWPWWWKTLHCCREAKNGGQDWNKLRHNGGITIVVESQTWWHFTIAILRCMQQVESSYRNMPPAAHVCL